MSTHHEATDVLRDVKTYLASAPQGELDSWRVETLVRDALRLLQHEEPQWVSAAEAKRLLGIELDSAVPYWAEMGWLRSRTAPDGSLQVRLDDVLYRRMEREGLLAFGGDEMTPEELRILAEGRPGKNPWERNGAHNRERGPHRGPR
ncbi:MAG TPA: hypothetical protein VII06_29320 [Chloroflexota bacterium]|jgi:hypothetical protein